MTEYRLFSFLSMDLLLNATFFLIIVKLINRSGSLIFRVFAILFFVLAIIDLLFFFRIIFSYQNFLMPFVSDEIFKTNYYVLELFFLIFLYFGINEIKDRKTDIFFQKKTSLIILFAILLFTINLFVTVFKANFPRSELLQIILKFDKLTGPIFTAAKLCITILIIKSINSGKKIFTSEFIPIYQKHIYLYSFLLLGIIAQIAFMEATLNEFFIIKFVADCSLAFFITEIHFSNIDTMKDQIFDLINEKDMIISLMEEMNTLITTGEMDLETFAKTITEESVSGTMSTGGAILIEDRYSHQLSVIYATGTYPPTKKESIRNYDNLNGELLTEYFRQEIIYPDNEIFADVLKGNTKFIQNVTSNNEYPQTTPEIYSVKSFIAVPLKYRNKIIGVLTVVSNIKNFSLQEKELLEKFGEKASINFKQFKIYQELMEKKTAEKDLETASIIQKSMFPDVFPLAEKFDLYGFSNPVKGVGGDFFDYINHESKKLSLCIFDVAGKGIPASLIMVMIRSAFRTIISTLHDTAEVMRILNNTISEEIINGLYATGFYILFDSVNNSLQYSNAGHLPAIIYRAEKKDFEQLDANGFPVGIMKDGSYEKKSTVMGKGDILILYTDGITEAMDSRGDMYEVNRLKKVIFDNKEATSKEITYKIRESVIRFMGDFPQHDDETVLVLKIL